MTLLSCLPVLLMAAAACGSLTLCMSSPVLIFFMALIDMNRVCGISCQASMTSIAPTCFQSVQAPISSSFSFD